jgi:AcrR family transcriptional regulator
VNEIRIQVHTVGRPRLELSGARRRALEQLALQIDRLNAQLAEARADLIAAARAGRSEGASIRAIAEAVGLSRPRVYQLLTDSNQALQAVESGDGATCG